LAVTAHTAAASASGLSQILYAARTVLANCQNDGFFCNLEAAADHAIGTTANGWACLARANAILSRCRTGEVEKQILFDGHGNHVQPRKIDAQAGSIRETASLRRNLTGILHDGCSMSSDFGSR